MTASARVATVERGASVRATTGDLPRYRSTVAIVSSDSPLAEIATTSVSGDGGHDVVAEAYSATASIPADRMWNAASTAAYRELPMPTSRTRRGEVGTSASGSPARNASARLASDAGF